MSKNKPADFSPSLAECDINLFLTRHSLLPEDLSVVVVNGAQFIRLKDPKKVAEIRAQDVIFDPPEPPIVPEVKTKQEYAAELLDVIAPGLKADEKDMALDKLLRVTGERPLEEKV